jgi:hypothetical protein
MSLSQSSLALRANCTSAASSTRRNGRSLREDAVGLRIVSDRHEAAWSRPLRRWNEGGLYSGPKCVVSARHSTNSSAPTYCCQRRLTSLNREARDVNRFCHALGVWMWMTAAESGVSKESRTDPFCRLVTKQRKLSKERDALVSHIRSLPRFGNFLMPPSFHTLRSAASRGPVIIINHSKWRSDILILLRRLLLPSLITAPSDFYDRANRLKDQLLSARQGRGDVLSTSVARMRSSLCARGLVRACWPADPRETPRAWASRSSLGYGGAQHPRVCFLPLHAMGPIPSADG